MWPIIHRELCAAMRDPAVRAIRMWVPVAGAAITALFLLVAMADRVTAGRMLLWMLTWGVMAMGLAQGGRLAMSAFAEDREQGTLGLLFLCGLKAHEVFVARVAGQAIVFCQVLLSVAPLLVVPVFLGGVSSDALLGIWSLLPSFLLLVMSIAVFAGLVCREPGEANILCLLLLIGSLGLGPGMHMLRQILVGDGRFAGLAWLGPFKGLTSLPREDWNLPWEELWISVGSTLAMVVLFLVCALWRVGRIWKQEIFNGGADSWGNLGRRQAQPTTLVP
ncbi:MAG: hypothetical protein KDM81_09555, partial [Verrucomicrobiae bacterium]|nr:hypothetical protein [Verrucomicrobiae bacterium]